MEKTKTVDASEITAKLSYSAPELTELGAVESLTQSNVSATGADGTSV